MRPTICPVIIDRQEELAAVSELIEAAAGGRGGLLALVGDAGVGKSRLAVEARTRAQQKGLITLTGRAIPTDAPIAYRPLAEALLVAARDGAGLRDAPDAPELRGVRVHLAKLVPEWAPEGQHAVETSPLLIGEAFIRLLRFLGKQKGCLLVIEDLHWADPETLAVVEYLADTIHSEPVLCVATARPDPGAASSGVLARARNRPGAITIHLPPLGEDQVEMMAAACLESAAIPLEVGTFLYTHSEGVPFLVEELLAGLLDSGGLIPAGDGWKTVSRLTPSIPLSFKDTVVRRLNGLGSDGRRVLAAAALLGRRFDWDLLPGITDLDGKAVATHLQRAVEDQLVMVDGEDFRFRHALTRSAVLDEVLPPERRALAERALQVVELAHPELPEFWCELAAELAQRSGDDVRAALLLVESGRRALSRGALASAETNLRQARDLAASDPATIMAASRSLVEVLTLAGKSAQAGQEGRHLLRLMVETSAPTNDQAEIRLVLARAAISGGDWSAAGEHVAEARSLARRSGAGDGLTARVDSVDAHVALEEVRLDDAETLARSAIDHASAAGLPEVECEALEVLGRLTRGPDTEEAMRTFQRAAEIARQHGLVVWRLRALHELAILDGYHLRRPDALRQTRQLAVDAGALHTVAVMDLTLADMGLGSLDRELCATAAAACVDAGRRFGLASLPVALLWLAGAHALAGREKEMEETLAEAFELAPGDPRILGDAWGRVRATFAFLQEDRDRLRAALDASMPYVRVAPTTTSIFPGRTLWALLHTLEDDGVGRSERAEVLAARHVMHHPAHEVGLALAEAIALGRDGRGDEATALVRANTSMLANSGMTTYALRLTAEAAIRDGWGDPAYWLRQAEAYFAGSGYERVAGRCRALLREAGAPAPRRGRGESEVPPGLRARGVTSREHDVLLLVVEGLPTKAIAAQLFLSPRTVEHHVASLFARLGVHNREELAASLRQTHPPAN